MTTPSIKERIAERTADSILGNAPMTTPSLREQNLRAINQLEKAAKAGVFKNAHTTIRERIVGILMKMDLGYRWQMSEIASTRSAEEKMEEIGIAEVKETADHILSLIVKEAEGMKTTFEVKDGEKLCLRHNDWSGHCSCESVANPLLDDFIEKVRGK